MNTEGEDASQLQPDLRAALEALFRRAATAGHIPDRGTRDLRFRLNDDGHVAWFEATRVRVAASELEAGFDETMGV